LAHELLSCRNRTTMGIESSFPKTNHSLNDHNNDFSHINQYRV
jgi:hypothetical protein